MKGFAIDAQGDVIIEKNDIVLAYDTELLIQKIRQVLSTNRGEWLINATEGVPVQKILKKNPNISMVKDCVRSAVAQVDKSLQMTRCDIVIEGRNLKINFTVSGSGKNTTVEMEV